MSARTVASHVLGASKNHVYCGSAAPEFSWMVKADPPLSVLSDCTKLVYPAGGPSPTSAFDRVVV